MTALIVALMRWLLESIQHVQQLIPTQYGILDGVPTETRCARLITHLDAVGDRRHRADIRKNGQVVKTGGAIIGSSIPPASNLCDETVSQLVGENEHGRLAPDSRDVVPVERLDNPPRMLR